MKTFPRLLLLCLGVSLCAWPLSVLGRKAPPLPTLASPVTEPAPLPAEAAPKISPEVPPSASLQPFLDGHLGKILAALGTPAFAQTELIAGMKASYGDGMAAAPDAHKAAYQKAQAVCDAMIDAIAERQKAVTALHGALAARSSEAAQPRGGTEAVQQARHRDAFFLESQQNSWLQRATALRESINGLAAQERAAEGPPKAWLLPKPAVAEAAPAPAPADDPVVGPWLMEGRALLTLAADHTITGGRHGEWRFRGEVDGKRRYELHWQPPKNWSDWVFLSEDGKTLEGHTRSDQHISYNRP